MSKFSSTLAESAAEQKAALRTFIMLSVGVLIFFCLASLWEEAITSRPGYKWSWSYTMIQNLFMTGFALGERWYFGEPGWEHVAPLKRHWVVAGAMTVSRGLTNISLLYLNYPTQVVFKSLKLLTVMIGSVLWVGRSYTRLEYVATFLVVCSAALFGLGDNDSAPKFEWIGIVIVLLSLVGDSMHSNTQETLLQDHRATLRETMVYSNLFSAACCFAVAVSNGEFTQAAAWMGENPTVWLLLPAQSILQYLGVLCFVSSIKRFGVVLATTVTTVRKIVTVLLSFLMYPKPFNGKYTVGILLFFGSFVLQYMVQRAQMAKGKGIGHNAAAAAQSQQEQPGKDANAGAGAGAGGEAYDEGLADSSDLEAGHVVVSALDDDTDTSAPVGKNGYAAVSTKTHDE